MSLTDDGKESGVIGTVQNMSVQRIALDKTGTRVCVIGSRSYDVQSEWAVVHGGMEAQPQLGLFFYDQW